MIASSVHHVHRGGVVRSTLVLLACLALAACAPTRTLSEEETAPVRIGLIAPLSGELGSDGPSWRDAVKLAVREVNAAGGVLPGRIVELSIENGESTASEGVMAAQRLVDAGVIGIIGDSTSSATLDVYNMVTLDEQVLLASGLSTSTELTDVNRGLAGDWYFFRTVPPDDGQAPALAEAMYLEGCRSIAILYADNNYGRPFLNGTRARLDQYADASVAIEQPYIEARADYAAEVTAIAAAAPDCIAMIAYPQSAGVILRNWNALTTPPPVTWFGTDGIYQAGLVAEVGDANLIDGLLGTAPLTDAPSPAYNRFLAHYRATFDSEPTAFSSNMYDAAALMLLAIARAGSTEDREAIRDAVLTLNDPGGTVVQAGDLAEGLRLVRTNRAINYEGASGPVVVDEDGNVEGVYELWRFTATGATSGDFTQERILE